MATQAQLALAAGGTAGAVAGGYGINYALTSKEDKQDSKGTQEEQNNVTVLDRNYVSSTYTNKLITLLQDKHLSSVIKNELHNQKWWDWAFKNKYESKKANLTNDPIFGNLEQGHSELPNIKSLNKACNQAYDQPLTKYEDSNLLRNIFDLCTKSDDFVSFTEPTYALYPSLPAEYNNGILSNPTNLTKLVNTTEETNNKYWWIWAFENLFKGKERKSTHFNLVDRAISKAEATDNDTKALNKVCDSAYKKPKEYLEEQNLALQTDIAQFCSISKDAVALEQIGEEPVSNTEPTQKEVFDPSDVGTNNKYETKLIAAIQDQNISKLVTNNVTNRQWWRWSYKHKFVAKKESKPLHDLFTKVNRNYHETEPTALNKVCESAYNQEKELILNDNLIANIADFCTVGSPEETKDFSQPKYVLYPSTEAVNEEDYKYGVLKKEGNKEKLVKDVKDNELWFKWSYKKIEKVKTAPNPGNTLGTLFITTDKGYSEEATALNKVCNESYKKGQYDIEKDNKLLANIKAYCSPLDQDIAKPEVEQIPKDKPTTVHSLDSSTGYETDTIATLMDPENVKKLAKTDSTNKEWWSWVFANKYETNKTDLTANTHHFHGVTMGYSDTVETALNKKCDSAYRKTKEHYKFDGNDKLLEHIGKFCNKEAKTNEDVSKPKVTLFQTGDAKDDHYKYGVLNQDSNKTKLVNTSKAENEVWWRWAFAKLYTGNHTDASDLFKVGSIDKGYDGNKSLKSACDEAYKKDKTDLGENGNKLKTDIEKFCVGSAIKGELTLPSAVNAPAAPAKLDTATDKTIGKQNQNHLYKTEGSEDWWKWALIERFKPYKANTGNKVVAPFANVTEGYGTSSDNKYLNQACKSAYAYNHSQTQTNQEDLLKNIKEFCTDKASTTNITAPQEQTQD